MGRLCVFKNTYELLNPGALNILMFYKDRIFQYMGKIYCGWNFKGTLWNSIQNILPIHWKCVFYHFIQMWTFKSYSIWKLISVLNPPPSPPPRGWMGVKLKMIITKHNKTKQDKRQRIRQRIQEMMIWYWSFLAWPNAPPPDTRRNNNVIVTSKRRRDVVLTQ